MDTTIFKIEVTEQNKNSLIVKRVMQSIKDKQTIKSYIREGKNLSVLNEKGIKFKMPV